MIQSGQKIIQNYMRIRKIEESPVLRETFAEGRNYGMGVAFAKRVGNKFVASQPLSACKDFLNDEVWSEVTGNEFKKYGQESFKKDLFNDKHYTYMLISFLNYNGNVEHSEHYLNHLENFKKSIPNIEKGLQKLDIRFKAGKRTKIFPTNNENIFLVYVPKKWVSTSYSISLYTLAARNLSKYSGEDLGKYFENKDNIYSQDMYLINKPFVDFVSNFRKLPEKKKGDLFNPEFSKFVNGDPHDKGIVEYLLIKNLYNNKA